MTPRTFVLLTVAAFNAVFVGYLCLWHRRRRIHRLLAAFLLGGEAYGLFVLGLAAAPTLATATTLVRYGVPLTYAFLFTSFRFSRAFSEMEAQPFLTWVERGAWILAGVDSLGRLFGVLPVVLGQAGGQGWYPSGDPAYLYLYTPVMLAMMLSSLGMLWWRWRHPHSALQRNQAAFIWLALALGLVLSSFNLFPEVRVIGAAAPLAFNLVMVYAMTRERLLDLEPLLREGLANTVMLALLLIFLALGLWLDGPKGHGLALVAGMFLFALLYQPLYHGLLRALRVHQAGQHQDVASKLLRYSLLGSRHASLDDQLRATLEGLGQDHGLTWAAILLPDATGRFSEFSRWPQSLAGRLVLEAASPIIRRLRELPEGMTTDSLGWAQRYETRTSGPEDPCLTFFRQERAQACFGLFTRQRLLGVLALGQHVAARPLTGEELTLLQALAGQLAMVVDNAALTGRVQAADRLSGLGSLAASLAHEIRNPLASVSMFVQMLPVRHADPEFRAKFERIVPAELQKLTGMTEQLLALARPATRAPQVVDLGALCLRLHRLVAHPFRQAELDLGFETPEGVLVQGTEEELSQVVLGLLLNALHAAPKGSPVRLGLDKEGTLARLRVTDQRGGQSQASLEAVFEPVFVAQGAVSQGLGLASSRRIAESLGGSLTAACHDGVMELALILPVAGTLRRVPERVSLVQG